MEKSVKFKQYQALHKETIDKLRALVDTDLDRDGLFYGDESLLLKKAMVASDKAAQLDSLTLAYMGDGVYSLFIRQLVVSVGILHVRVLHAIVTSFICAKAQARALEELEASFNEVELQVAKRARNSHVHVPKSATVQEYRWSTAFEAVLGYLYMTQQTKRLQSFMKQAFITSLKGL